MQTTRELLRRAMQILAALMRGETPAEDTVSDLYSDIAEHIDGHDPEQN